MILQLAGIVEPYPPQAMAHVEYARELGTVVHEWAEFVDQRYSQLDLEAMLVKLENTVPHPYLVAYRKFLDKYDPEWQYIETPFSREGIAGCPDRVGWIWLNPATRIPVIIDLKTSQKSAPHWQIQLTAYQWLMDILECHLFVLHLGKDESFELLPYAAATNVWEAAITVSKWKIAAGMKVK